MAHAQGSHPTARICKDLFVGLSGAWVGCTSQGSGLNSEQFDQSRICSALNGPFSASGCGGGWRSQEVAFHNRNGSIRRRSAAVLGLRFSRYREVRYVPVGYLRVV